MTSAPITRFRGPHAGYVALVYVVLFCAGLFPVTAFGGSPYFPPPTAPLSDMVAFFSTRSTAVLLCAFLQFGSAIPLGPGFSVPFGIFIAGVAVTAGLTRRIPRWLMWVGIAIAVCGEVSWFEMVNGKFLPFIPLTRFPGFLWSILVGFTLPRTAAIASRA